MLEKLKEEVLQANLELNRLGLSTLTWGNVSGICRSEELIAIKPSGISYESLKAQDIVILDLKGRQVEGSLYPSSDTPTHMELYKAFPEIGGIAHAHSTYGTIFAQALLEIPCLGTTHADHFNGKVPLTRFLTDEEVFSDYEKNTGKVIAERFAGLNAENIPGVLVAGHAPFCWGKNAMDAVYNCLILERVAHMAFCTLQLRPDIAELPDYISQKHFLRKHGPNSYYGQKQ